MSYLRAGDALSPWHLIVRLTSPVQNSRLSLLIGLVCVCPNSAESRYSRGAYGQRAPVGLLLALFESRKQVNLIEKVNVKPSSPWDEQVCFSPSCTPEIEIEFCFPHKLVSIRNSAGALLTSFPCVVFRSSRWVLVLYAIDQSFFGSRE